MVKKCLLTALFMMVASTCMAAWVPYAEGNGSKYFYDDASFAYANVRQQDGSFKIDKSLVSVDQVVTMPKAQANDIATKMNKPEFKEVTQTASRIFFYLDKDNMIVPLVMYLDNNGKVILKEGSPNVWGFNKNEAMLKLAKITRDYAKGHDKELVKRAKSSVKK